MTQLTNIMMDRTYTTHPKNEESQLGVIEFYMREQKIAKPKWSSNTTAGENLFSLIIDQFLHNLTYKCIQLIGKKGMI